MSKIWTNRNGQKFELKHENGEWWYRQDGEGDDKWKSGMPADFSEKPTEPLT
jgi:hypothetical protein